MALAAGARLGPYEILSALGSGGMGEVYRAHDTKLGRDVALKILPESFTHDPERIARFKREAQVLASLNHPHIGAIYGLDDANGQQFLVLELIDGETIADRLKRGALPLEEALAIAKQIAEALEAAHERGIIHRDLKPANIAVTKEGNVKVLDFGLAKATEASSSVAVDLANSPTLTSPPMRTGIGVILGTAAYMAPEQAKGRAVDRRSDMWAFGCVLYEMLVGHRAFEGEDVSDTLAFVLTKEPDWRALSKTPAPISRLLRRCLEKDRKRRLADAADAQLEIHEAQASPAAEMVATTPHRLASVAIAASVGTGLTVALIAWAVVHTPPQTAGRTSRFAIVPPPAEPLSQSGYVPDVAISPDGAYLVYPVGPQSQLVVRSLDQLEARPLPGSAGIGPFVSPDGRWIGFFSTTRELKKVSVTGGPPITLSRNFQVPRGASWGSDDTIIFATIDPSRGLLSVPAGGGEPKTLTKPDTARGEAGYQFPSVLPGGRAVLFTIAAPGSPDDAQIAVFDRTTGQHKTLVRGGSQAEYVESGHLVYAVAGGLRAVRFDLGRLEVTSDPVPVVDQLTVGTGSFVATNFAVSPGGTLLYVPRGVATSQRSLVWVDRQGHEESLNAPPRPYELPRISPDGTRVALQIGDQDHDIWIWDLMRHRLTRLTFDPGVDQLPVWTPDSRRIIFNSTRGGVLNLYWQAADGTGSVERLTTSTNPQFPFSMTPDGTRVLLGEVSPETAADVRQLVLQGERRTEPIIQTSFAEYSPEISPNGRWVAYQSNESGQFQIYARPFPNVDGGRWQISTGGGTRPVWARNGRELFYLDLNGALTAVPVQTAGSTFSPGNPAKVLDTRYYIGFLLGAYDVSLDGQRFLMIKENPGDKETGAPASLIVVQHWDEELKRLVPAK